MTVGMEQPKLIRLWTLCKTSRYVSSQPAQQWLKQEARLLVTEQFTGNTRGIFVDKREYGGNLWDQVEQAYQFVLRNIHLGARIKGIHRQDVYELPPESIRELIINAVVNCSFLQGSLVQVAIYDNRLEISSPGGLMPEVTIEKMKEGFSKVRNHGIANAFVYMNLIEQWGSGIPKILTQTVMK